MSKSELIVSDIEVLITQLMMFTVVLVGLYEEPEKPNNALEYPCIMLSDYGTV